MAEYIDREAAIKMLRGTAIAKYPSSFALGIFASARELENLQSADVAPVRHMRWIIDSAGGKIACSDCGCIYLRYNGRLKPNYCPNCGAKMRGINDE